MRTQRLLMATLFCGSALACERDPVLPQEPVVNPRAGAIPQAPTDTMEPKAEAKKSDREAEAKFQSAAGIDLRGEAEFEETPEGLRIEVEVKSAPVGLKGIHVHEKGDCSDIRGNSMGPHFAPDTKEHGLPEAEAKHLGDLGNIQIDSDGTGKLKILVPKANLKPGDTHSFLGKALVIHTAQDQGTGPSGQSGDPIACAVIEKD